MTVTSLTPRRRSRTAQRWHDLDLLEVDFTESAGLKEVDWVDAAPFRAHVRQLIDSSQLPWRTVAMLAEVPANSLNTLMHGRSRRPVSRIHPLMAHRLFHLTSESVADAARQQVGAADARTLVQRLLAHGWTIETLSRRIGMVPGQLAALVDGNRASVSRLSDATIRAAAQALLTSSAPPAPKVAGGRSGHDLAA